VSVVLEMLRRIKKSSECCFSLLHNFFSSPFHHSCIHIFPVSLENGILNSKSSSVTSSDGLLLSKIFFPKVNLMNGLCLLQQNRKVVELLLILLNYSCVLISFILRRGCFKVSISSTFVERVFSKKFLPPKFQTQKPALLFLAPKICTKNVCKKQWWNCFKVSISSRFFARIFCANIFSLLRIWLWTNFRT